jgi:peptidyl-prolyl cis-trans isomerase A (cyclophilin A)
VKLKKLALSAAVAIGLISSLNATSFAQSPTATNPSTASAAAPSAQSTATPTPPNQPAPAPAPPATPPPPSAVETLIPLPSAQEVHAIIKTSMGKIDVKLFPSLVPHTVYNFIGLAKGEKEFVDIKSGKKTKRPFYNGLTFHRAVKGFLIQGGCPYGTGRGGPGYTIPDEFRSDLRHSKPGIVSMASMRSGGGLQKDSNGSQFFITLRAAPELDDKATIFGEVVSGMHIVRKIASVPVGPTDRPIKKVVINAIDIVETQPANK